MLSFNDFRLRAAREFAQTMIVVDDEATQSSEDLPETRVSTLQPPSKLSPPKPISLNESQLLTLTPTDHGLNAKTLIDNAMDIGLVCCVLRPKKGEMLQTRVATAARHADIVCLDWEIYRDGGDSATKIIREILRSDAKRKGRLRLIAIYTGDKFNNQILEKIMEGLPKSFREHHDLHREPLYIGSKDGLRIICLFKMNGIKLTDARKINQVSEEELPKRLRVEFSKLAEGLLSNVALATIASIRGSTHHVLAQFTASMDGPYFHHRGVLENVRDAEEYAVDVVLSELKNAIDKQNVAEIYAGKEAIESRIREIAGSASVLHLRYVDKNGTKDFPLNVDDAINIIIEGYKVGHAKINVTKPGAGTFKQELVTLFFGNRSIAHAGSQRFAALTGVRTYPASHLYKGSTKFPHLGLGTIIRSTKGVYLLCLQATCDSVRIKGKAAFLFVPLMPVPVDKLADHVVPVAGKEPKHIGLSMTPNAYSELVSLNFDSNATTETVMPERISGKRGLFFRSSDGVIYLWIATLKERRALRTAQRLGTSMGRLGFDEFEPFRK